MFLSALSRKCFEITRMNTDKVISNKFKINFKLSLFKNFNYFLLTINVLKMFFVIYRTYGMFKTTCIFILK